MNRFHLVACCLVLVGCVGSSATRQLGFLNRYQDVTKRLETYIAEHGTDTLKEDDIQTLTIEQKLDHFNPASTETWLQWYAVSKHLYKGNNLIFLMIQGESPMSPGWLQSGFMAEQAAKFKAAMFVLEHRFYGKSNPKPDRSTDALKYLNSEQALADLAHFITRMNIEHGFTNPKWIVFGGSYAGSLAAWHRFKYPHLVHAAVASSGPLHAKVDFPEYYQTVSKVMSTVTPKCVEAISTATRKMSEGMHNKTKREHYQQLFNLCKPLDDDEKDIASFFELIAETFANVVQYHRSEKTKPSSGFIDLETACEMMTDEKIECPVHRLAEWIKLVSFEYCMDHTYSNLVAFLKDTSMYEMNIYRQWLYQTCTEFGWYPTSSKKKDTFGDKFPVEFYVDLCGDVYDTKFNAQFLDKSINETNLNYGGYSLPVSRVIFTHGRADPWSPLGITKKPPKGSYAFFIKGASHCADLVPGYNDPPQLEKVREKMSHIIERWTSEKKHVHEEQSIFHF